MAAPKGTARTMSEIRARLMTPATTSNYEVYFKPPEMLTGDIGSAPYSLPFSTIDQDMINLSCIDTTLPGSSFMTHEITNDRPGITEKHVYRRSFDGEISFTFLVDRNYKILRFFEGWMASITNEGRNGFVPNLKNSPYRVRFPKDYQADYITITKFEKDVGRDDEQSQLQYTFLGAYPTAINSIPISYEQSDILKATVSMSYIRYFMNLK